MNKTTLRSAPAPLTAAFVLLAVATTADAQTAGWDQSVQISANAWYGAAQARIIATDLGVGRTDSALSVRSDFQMGYADDRDDLGVRRVTARAFRAGAALDYRPFARWSPFIFGTIESSLQQRIARRYNAGAGAKLTLLRKDKDDLSVSLALLQERTRTLTLDDSPEAVTGRTRWSLRFRYRRQLTPTIFVSHVTFYQPEVRAFADRYLVDANSAIEVAVTTVLSLTATHRHRYDSEALLRGAESNTDGQVLFGVKARF